MRKHILISAGPIPAKLDSVKLITNKFKGGLALHTAAELAPEFQITVVAHESTAIAGLPEGTAVITVRDVLDYYRVIQETRADAYVLAGAVANLMPVKPWEGKFPSHHYQEGEVFDIPFTLAPRIIDRVRQWYPQATLIGYKLFDGTEEELIAAGRETLRHSAAHLVFCNHPRTAKQKKIALTSDGAIIPMDFAEHIRWIKKAVNLEWYRTEILPQDSPNPHRAVMKDLLGRIATNEGALLFGTVAVRDGAGFWTTVRGKTTLDEFAYVHRVDHETQMVCANRKATLNAPTLARIFELNPSATVILHGHRQPPQVPARPYAFPGTTEEVALAQEGPFAVEHHGYYVPLRSLDEAATWIG